MTSRKKPGVAFWATVGLVVVLLAYPLSFGPACWWLSKEDHGPVDEAIMWFYWPLNVLYSYAPKPIQQPLDWWCNLWGG